MNRWNGLDLLTAGSRIAQVARECGASAVCGGESDIPLVVAAIQHEGARGGSVTHGCVVRTEQKGHGTRKAIENCPAPGTSVLLVNGGEAIRRKVAKARLVVVGEVSA